MQFSDMPASKHPYPWHTYPGSYTDYSVAFSCERTKFTRPGDFLVFLVFCGAVIVVSNALDS